jgi:uncharacterized ubiquitin-like protein YukD
VIVLYITVTIKSSDQYQADIQADENQTITDVIKILAGRLMPEINQDAKFVKAMRGLRVVSAYATFREAGILDGDTIQIL